MTSNIQTNTFSKKRTVGDKLVNPKVSQSRLNNEQKIFYTKLFYENATEGKVKKENFLPLLGIFGTQIAQDFSNRMFFVLSGGETEISLDQYLNYIDIYHYGDIHERCLYTCKLMDTKQKGKIELEDFQSYITLIINTVKKVNNTLTKKDLMSDKDIEYLFYHISKGKNYFTYSDFENTYKEKPELVSWFDYFKNDKEDILLIIDEYIPIVLKVFNDFLANFNNDLFVLLDKEEEINLELIFKKVLNYSNKLEKIMEKFIDKISKFNITNAFSCLTKQNYNKSKYLLDLQNKKFDSKENKVQNTSNLKNDNIDAFFNQIKKSIYKQKEKEKEIILDNKKIKYPIYNADKKYFAEKLVKRSNAFRNKNFRFYNNYINLRRCPINNYMRRNSLILNKPFNIKNNLNNNIIINKPKSTMNYNLKMNNFTNFRIGNINNNIYNYNSLDNLNNKIINNNIKFINYKTNIPINNFHPNYLKGNVVYYNNIKYYNKNNNIYVNSNNFNNNINYYNNYANNFNNIKSNYINAINNNNISNQNYINNINYENNPKNTISSVIINNYENNTRNTISSVINNNYENNTRNTISTNNNNYENNTRNTISSNINNNNFINNNYENTTKNTNNTVNNNNLDKLTLDVPTSNLHSTLESTSYSKTNFNSLKETQKLKQLLFYARVIIEKALETNAVFNNCYKWISENYLSKIITKKIKEEKLKSKKKKIEPINSSLNIPKKVVPVKKKIIGASEKSFEILFNMIMGIQIAVQAIPNFRIKDREEIKKYLTNMIYSIQTVYLGNDNEESYLLKEFGGVIFNNIRLYLGINKDDFIKSISPQDFITELMISSQTILEELCSTGSSGSLLYYTRDGEFIVKTISKNEFKFLKTMIGEYFFYLKNNPLSFLPKLLGAYVLKRKYKKNNTNIYFIVMSNVFATNHHIDLRFDLKGSTIGRKVLKGTQDDNAIFSNGDMALKDLDFNKSNERVYIGSKREVVLNQIKKDIEFLYSINSNDYSLLLGIHCLQEKQNFNLSRLNTLKNTEYNKMDEFSFLSENTRDFLFTNTKETESSISSENSAVDRINKLKEIYDFEDGGILSKNKNRIYYFGIIDILTQFTKKKRLEYWFKKLRYCSEDMSCIPPIYYKQRFYNYIQIVFAQECEQTPRKKENDNSDNKNFYKVDKYGAISSSNYKEKKNEISEKYTEEESIQKL